MPNLSPAQQSVLNVIRERARGDRTILSNGELAEAAGIKATSVMPITRKLKALKLIEVQHTRNADGGSGPNIYRVPAHGES